MIFIILSRHHAKLLSRTMEADFSADSTVYTHALLQCATDMSYIGLSYLRRSNNISARWQMAALHSKE
jgi:hypothetical protein